MVRLLKCDYCDKIESLDYDNKVSVVPYYDELQQCTKFRDSCSDCTEYYDSMMMKRRKEMEDRAR